MNPMVGEPPSALEGIWEAKNAGAYDRDEDVGWFGTTAACSASGQRLGILVFIWF